MSACRPASALRSPRARAATLRLAAWAALCLPAAGQALDVTGWTLFDPDNDWNVGFPSATSLLMTEQVTSSSAHPAWVVSDVALPSSVTIEFDLSVTNSAGDDDLIGFGFSWLDGSNSWLLDWKRSTQSFNWGHVVAVNDDTAEQGLKIKRINGSYTWDGLWGGTDGLGVSTVAGPAGGPWVAGTVYHFVIELSPGRIIVTRDGVPLFDVTDPSFPGGAGRITSYGFSQKNVLLSNVVTTPNAWTDLGFALAGVHGAPLLVGDGAMTEGSDGSLSLSNAAGPGALAVLFSSFASTPAPFKGGTLVPVPVIVSVSLATAGSPGGIVIPWTDWPVGYSGLVAYFQYGIADFAGPQGVALSNAVRVDVP